MSELDQTMRGLWQVDKPVRPILGESLNGYLSRTAAENWIGNTLALTSLAGATHGHRPEIIHQRENLARLSYCLQVDLNELWTRAYPQVGRPSIRSFYGTVVKRCDLELRIRRFSPGSLADSPHHHALWQLRLFPFCHETWEYLVDKCPRCGAIQRWYHANGVDRCDHCVEDLTRASTASVPIELRRSLAAAIGLLHPDPRMREASLQKLPAPLRELDGASAYELLLNTSSLLIGHMKRVRSIASNLEKGPLTEIVARAWEVMEGWPDTFHAFALERAKIATKRHHDGNDGKTVRFLKLSDADQLAAPVRKIIRTLRRSIDLEGARREEILSTTYTMAEAQSVLGIKPNLLARGRRNNALRSIFLLNGTRAALRFDRTEIDHLREVIEQRRAPDSFAWQNNLPFYAIEQLMVMGILPTEADAFCAMRYGSRQPTKSGISQFEQRLAAAANSQSLESPITLKLASRSIGGRLKPWGPIIEALLRGTIRFNLLGSNQTLVQRVLVDRSAMPIIADLAFDVSVYPSEPWKITMPRRDLGDVLNLNSRDYTRAARVLPPSDTSSTDVKISDALDMARTHIGSSELGIRLNVPARSLHRLARDAGVPVLGPAGWCRHQAEARLIPP